MRKEMGYHAQKSKKKYAPKPHRQIYHPVKRVQIVAKVVSRAYLRRAGICPRAVGFC